MTGAWRSLARRLNGATLLLLAFAVGCEEPFQAIQEGDHVFSMYGFLDAGADTQWVRVTPFRSSIHGPPGPIDATVTLEHLGTGRTTVLTDSLFGFPPVNLGENDFYAYNFSTTEPIEPGATYRLRATRSDGKSARVTVQIPRDDDELVVRIFNGLSGRRNSIFALGAEHVAIVNVLWDFWNDCPKTYHEGSQPPLAHTSESGVEVPLYAQAPESLSSCLAYDRRIRFVTSGSAWPVTPLETVSHLNAASNVEGGVGFVGGVRIRLVPYDNCVLVDVVRTLQGPWCEIRYNAASATVHGRVLDAEGRLPLKGSMVHIHQVGTNRTRPTFISPTGSYTIGGLDPTESYLLQVYPVAQAGHLAVSSCDPPLPLTVASGEERRVDVWVAVSPSGGCVVLYNAE